MPADATPPPDDVIDLGTEFDAVVPTRAVRVRKPQRDRLRIRRGWWSVPVIVVLLLAAGSVVPGRLPLALVGTVQIGGSASVLVSGGEAVVLDVRDSRDHVSAYDLGGGGLIWSSPIDVPAADAGLRVVSGTVVVSTADPSASGVATEVFNLATGKPLWHSVDSVVAIDVNNRLVTDFSHTDGTETLQQVLPVTGRIGWTLEVSAGCSTVFGTGASDLADRLVELCLPAPAPGRMPIDRPILRSIDLDNGTLIASRSLLYHASDADVLVPPDQRMRAPEVAIIGDLTLLLHNGFPPAVDAFDARSLQPAWTGTPAMVGDTITRCGTLICLVDGAQTAAIDPDSGSLVPAIGTSAQLRLVLVPVDPAHPTAHPSAIPHIDTGVNVNVPAPEHGAAWIEEQNVDSETLRQLQPVAGVGARSCFTSGDYLVCATATTQLTFWKLPKL
ncbi:MAG TPA: hypothetical protein VGF84_14805 [Micromonosporaceae bacterium]